MKILQRKIKQIDRLLIKRFGIPDRSSRNPDPVDLLIATILSQNTNDRNSYKAFRKLKDSFTDWDEVEKLPASKIEKYIRVAGLGKQKSNAIKGFLKQLKKQNGKISLSYLETHKDSDIIEELTNYNGIGVKTASCVLLFAMGRNVCPVDTHVHRTANRIGLVNTNTPDKTFMILNEDFPAGIAHSFHTNLIKLGRGICRPAKPWCAVCPLLKICEYQNKNLELPGKTASADFMLLDNVSGWKAFISKYL
jgi:endonuclease-3